MRNYVIFAAMIGAMIAGKSAKAEEVSGPISIPMQFFAERMAANAQSASREHTDIARAVRTVLGISFVDIERYGIFGGPNSFFRKPFG